MGGMEPQLRWDGVGSKIVPGVAVFITKLSKPGLQRIRQGVMRLLSKPSRIQPPVE